MKNIRAYFRRLAPILAAPVMAALGTLLTPSFTPAAHLAAQSATAATEYEGAAALGLALRRLGPTHRVLMIAAHPDDENTAILASLALGAGADVAYLSLTRGEGGQNGIGPELQEALGIIRSEELLAARRLDGARQFFTRAYDYGFSKSADEAFQHWPVDSIVSDAVAVIRRFRPDIIISIFTGTPSDGHGQHQAAGIVAREAFTAAGDPARFPEQIARGLRPHQPARYFQARWRGGDSGITLQTGTFDPLLGYSYHQIALASRGRHRSQDMGRALVPGPQQVTIQWVAGTQPTGPSLFAGLDTTLSARARGSAGARRAPHADSLVQLLTEYDDAVPELRASFNPLAPAALVPELARLAGLLETAHGLAADPELRFQIAAELDDARAALARAAGVVVDAIASSERITPGQETDLELIVWNGGSHPLEIEDLAPVLPSGWDATPSSNRSAPAATASGGPQTLAPGTLLSRRFRVRAPADAEPTEPYYLREARDGDIYRWPDDVALRGLPFEPPALHAAATLSVSGAKLTLEREVEYRAVSSTEGESRRPVLVTPPISVALQPVVAVLPVSAGTTDKAATTSTGPNDGRALHFSVELATDAADGIAGILALELPPGWSASPATTPVRLESRGERRRFDFAVTPPANASPGAFPVRAVFTAEDGARYDRGYDLVDYHHIRARPLYSEAAATVQLFDVRVAEGLRVAYIPGAGDAIPEALAQLGVPVTIIDPADLATADLSPFQTVVLGIRAYEHQPELPRQNRRLLEFVEGGGTLIVQYNQYRFSGGGFAPYPLTIARPHDRVTDETAPVRLLDPTHPALSWPNRISDKDFEGWIQERGLYFARTWDEHFTPLLAMSDPGEDPLHGGLLVARYGKGTYVYTGLAFFRQLPAGVTGAYRLFANLVSLGRGE